MQKRFLDKEKIVQEASSSAFSILLTTNKEKITPYLEDILNIISTIFTRYSETSIIILHDIAYILTKYYKEEFQKFKVVELFIKSIIKSLNEKIIYKDFQSILYIIEIIPSLFKSSGYNVLNFIDNIMQATFEIINIYHIQYNSDKNNLSVIDKDIINKCLDLISVIYLIAPAKMIEFKYKNNLVENIFKLLDIDDNYIKHFVIAVIGEIIKIDQQIFFNYIIMIANILIYNLDLNEFNKLDSIELDKLSVCNNCCWTLGLFVLYYPKFMMEFMQSIMKKLIIILTHSKVSTL